MKYFTWKELILLNEILKLINKIFRNDEFTKHVAASGQYKINELLEKIEDLKNNIFLDTATWYLNTLEKELNLEYSEDKSISERKDIISAKWRGAGKLTLELLQDTVRAYTDNTVNVKFNGVIIIDFSSKIGKPKDVKSLMKSIEEVIPAHLGVEYVFRQRTWGELLIYDWTKVKASNWIDILESEDI